MWKNYNTTPATVSKQRCLMLPVEQFFRQSNDKVGCCFDIVAGVDGALYQDHHYAPGHRLAATELLIVGQ